jgi:hypothetical protein
MLCGEIGITRGCYPRIARSSRAGAALPRGPVMTATKPAVSRLGPRGAHYARWPKWIGAGLQSPNNAGSSPVLASMIDFPARLRGPQAGVRSPSGSVSCSSSSVGRASPCQGEGRGFEPHLLLSTMPSLGNR